MNPPPLSTPIRTPDSPPQAITNYPIERDGSWDSATGRPPPTSHNRPYQGRDNIGGSLSSPPPAFSPNMAVNQHDPYAPRQQQQHHRQHRHHHQNQGKIPPPPPPPPSPASISSNRDEHRHTSKSKKDTRTFWHRFLELLFCFLVFLAILAALALFIIGYKLDSLIGVDADLANIPPQMMWGAIFIWGMMTVGLLGIFVRRKWLLFIFTGGMVVLLLGQLYQNIRLTNQLDLRLVTVTNNWDTISPAARSQVQILGNCCGYYDPQDRPGEFCPETADEGCKFRINEMARSLKSLMHTVFFVSLVYATTLALLFWFLVRSA